MKQHTYIISPKEENEINYILDSGINELNSGFKFDSEPTRKSFGVNYTSNNYSNESNPNLNNFINKPITYSNVRDDLKNLQNNINQLEQKLFTSGKSIAKSNQVSDWRSRIVDKDNEIIELRGVIEREQRENEALRKAVNDLKYEKENLLKELQLKDKSVTDLKTYKEDFDKLRRDYRELFKEFKCSEEIRNEQKILIRHLQEDIDAMRMAAVNRINRIEMNSKINRNAAGIPEKKRVKSIDVKKNVVKKKKKINKKK